jgi:hypothetical protein
MNRRSLIARLAGIGVAFGAVLSGCGGGSSTTQTPLPARVELVPACSNPAPLDGTYDPRAERFIVIFVDGTTGSQVLEQVPLLAAKYGFTPRSVYQTALQGFSAELTVEQVAVLRCDPLIDHLSYNALFSGGDGGDGEED